MRGISVLLNLSMNLSQSEKQRCLSFFINNGFLAYNYQKEEYEDAKLLLSEEYFSRKRYLLSYHNEDFVISCSSNKSFLTYTIDGDNDYSKVIIEISDYFSEIFNYLDFLYIDNEGDRPDYLPIGIKETIPNALFKYNYFGLKYIEKYGKDFFENFPANQVKFINNRVVRIDLVDNIFDSVNSNKKEKVRNYLKEFGISHVNFYDANEYRF